MAGNAGAIRAGRAYYELYEDRNPLVKGLKAAEGLVTGSVKKIGSTLSGVIEKVASLKGLIGAAIAGTGAFLPAKLFANMGAELTDLARKTGASQAALASLGYAAKQTGSDLHSIAGLLTTLRDKEIEAARGGDQAQLAFARLGINFVELSSMRPDDQLRLVAERLKSIENPAIRAALATELLGSADMLPTLDRLSEMEARAKRLGLVLSNEDARAAKEFSMTLTDAWESLKMLGVEIGAKSAPLLTDLANAILNIIGNIRDWIGKNGSLTGSVKLMWAEIKLAFFAGGARIANIWNQATELLESAWINLWSKLKQGLYSFIATFKTEWNDAVAWLSKRLIDVREIAGFVGGPGGLSSDEAKAARRDIEANRKQDNAGAADAVNAEERSRKARQEELRARALNRQKDFEDDIKRQEQAIARLKAEIKNQKENPKLPAANNRGPGQAGGQMPGIGAAVMHVKGVAAHDVRTTQGLTEVMAALRQGQNPMLSVLQRQFGLQGQQFIEQRRLREDVEKLKVRDF